ncbi:MAG: lysophospholipid acyltransferase family protein [Candidatus Metalachnospira sp.]|nr:lysophospholipid acyltransferase family protein [Candidatus Metalachnospira sp.]
MFFRTIKVYIKTVVSVLYLTPRLKKADAIRQKEGLAAGDAYVGEIANNWAKGRMKDIGSKVIVTGAENIPKDRNFVLIANHQSDTDVFAVLSTIGRPLAFVAKVELEKIPILKIWMEELGCLFMNRSDMRQSMKTILEGIKRLNAGCSLAIFPEGTRAVGPMLEFKGGSFKLATKSNVPILPLTIDGTHEIYEDNHGWIKPAEIRLTYHPIIETKDMSKEEQKELPQRVQAIIGSVLKEEERFGKDKNTDC